MTERISGKVARVTSDRELMINRGSDQGVSVGMHFFVRDDPIEVPDPDTGEVLGSVTPIKVVVEIAEVSERFSIARTFRKRRVKVQDEVPGNPALGNILSGFSSSLQPPRPAKYETHVETLRLDPREGAPLRWDESIVTVGDIVESVLDGEDIDPITTTLFR